MTTYAEIRITHIVEGWYTDPAAPTLTRDEDVNYFVHTGRPGQLDDISGWFQPVGVGPGQTRFIDVSFSMLVQDDGGARSTDPRGIGYCAQLFPCFGTVSVDGHDVAWAGLQVWSPDPRTTRPPWLVTHSAIVELETPSDGKADFLQTSGVAHASFTNTDALFPAGLDNVPTFAVVYASGTDMVPPVAAIPEPAVALLLAAGLITVAARRLAARGRPRIPTSSAT